MKRLYEKSELWFALFWIALFSAGQSLANPLNTWIGIEASANALLNIALTAFLFRWIRKNGLMERYGLCRSQLPARRFLWYLPLVLLASHNLWNGAAVNFSLLDGLCYIGYMISVGFVEEVLFRGFLFRAVAGDSVRLAAVISSVTFGLGHLLHLVNGSGAELVPNLCQAFGAMAVGFLFVTIFYRGGSLLPCIFTHSAIDAVSAFANETGLTVGRRVVLSLAEAAVAILYALFLARSLPVESHGRGDGGQKTDKEKVK